MSKPKNDKLCAHPRCNCFATPTQEYCSTYCAASPGESWCSCGHLECQAAVGRKAASKG
jgi:hypothetical protein